MKLAVSREEQMNTSVAVENAVEVEPARRRFTVDEFQRMGEAGIFAPDERLELIGGEVIHMSPLAPGTWKRCLLWRTTCDPSLGRR
jgi:hypothetical protein